MKELGFEEKAKRYDKALEKARQLCAYPTSKPFISDLQDLFPELKESEDERIRKELLEYCRKQAEIYNTLRNAKEYSKVQSWLVWLEKQGEKTSDKIVEKARTEKQRVLLTETDGSANIDWDGRSLDDVKILLKCGLEFIRTIEANKQILTDNRFGGCSFRVPTRYDKGIKQGEKKPADEVEHKFKVGDFLVSDYCMGKVVELTNDAYLLDTEQGIPFSCEHNAHIWTIQDAKAGDVLACPNDAGDRDVVFVFKNINSDEGWVFCYCAIDANGCFCTNNDYVGNSNSTNIFPATEEQRNQLKKAIADAGYEWNAEKKELKKIEQKPVIKMKTPEESLGIDSDTYNKIVDECVYGEQNPAWSEEDNKIIEEIINDIECARAINYHAPKEGYEFRENWLKSLKDRYTWKPSAFEEEQRDMIKFAKHFFELGIKAQHDNWKVVYNINLPQVDRNKIYCVFTKDRYILAKIINHPQDGELLQWKCTEFPHHCYDMCEGDEYMEIV